jgi:hypothetical protein
MAVVDCAYLERGAHAGYSCTSQKLGNLPFRGWATMQTQRVEQKTLLLGITQFPIVNSGHYQEENSGDSMPVEQRGDRFIDFAKPVIECREKATLW